LDRQLFFIANRIPPNAIDPPGEQDHTEEKPTVKNDVAQLEGAFHQSIAEHDAGCRVDGHPQQADTDGIQNAEQVFSDAGFQCASFRYYKSTCLLFATGLIHALVAGRS
jgi:hypothetical protein